MGDDTVFVGKLQVAEDYAFQQREWKVQRVAWLVWIAVMLAALVGLTGDGPMAWRTTGSSDDGLTVGYEWVTRHRAPSEIVVTIANPAEQLEVAVDGGWVRGMEVDAVVPEPESVAAGPDRVVYTFSFEPGEQAAVTFTVRPIALGMRHGSVAIGDRPAVRFRQFVLP